MDEVRQRMQRLEQLIQETDQCDDPATRVRMQGIMRGVMDLHGQAIERIFEQIAKLGPGGQDLIDRLGDDEVVSSLLVLYGLHPLDFDSRVRRALEEARSLVEKHGAKIDLLSLNEGRVHLILRGGKQGCGSGNPKQVLEDALATHAPDAASIEIEEEAPLPNFVPVGELLLRGS